jgi:hypothetical protein
MKKDKSEEIREKKGKQRKDMKKDKALEKREKKRER